LEAGFRSGPVAALAVVLLTAVLALGAAQAASAAPTLLAPGNGKVLENGSRPTFKVRDGHPNAHRYKIFMRISAKRRTTRGGELKKTEVGTFVQMVARGRAGFVYKTPDYSFPTWFMARPGTYYWQAFHIDCTLPRVKDCHDVSAIHSFKVQ
jgi:hypothetical protein